MAALSDVLAALQNAVTVAQAYTPPAPIPSPVIVPPKVVMQPLDLSRIVCLVPQYMGWDRYMRVNILWYVTKAGTVDFCAANVKTGGTSLNFSYLEYGLLFNGVERARVKPGAVHRGTFTFTLGSEQGHVLTQIVAYDASGNRVTTPTECFPPFWIIVDQDGSAKNLQTVIRQYGSFEWTHPETPTIGLAGQPGVYAYVEMPIDMAEPQVVPIGPRTLTPIPAGCLSTKLTRTPIVPARDDDHPTRYRTVWNRAGVPSANNLQAYYPEDASLANAPFAAPRLPTVDGPRGMAMVNPATWLRHAHANGLWFGDAWSARSADGTGRIRTLYGLRHKRPPYSGHDALPDYYEAPSLDDPNVEIVNENSWPPDTPREQRYPQESWSADFDPATVGVDPSRPMLPISVNGTTVLRPQHATMPALWQSCRHGRMIRARFHGNTDNLPAGYTVDAQGMPRDAAGNYVDLHDLPPIIETFPGYADPWGSCIVDGTVYVCERGRNAISMTRASDGTKLGDVIANPAGALRGAIGDRRRFQYANFSYNDVVSGAAAKACRAEPILAPEGLDWWKDAAGDLWLYWGSYAQGEVRRINVRTKEVNVVCRPFVGWLGKSWYVYVRVGKGALDGVVGTTTWSEAATAAGGFGRPELFLPVAGTAADGTALTNSKPWLWSAATMAHVLRGPGGRTSSMAYASAFDLSEDRITCSSSAAGLDEWTLADPAAPLPDETRCANGFAWWKAQAGLLLDGSQYPLPTGQNADFDYWKQYSGY